MGLSMLTHWQSPARKAIRTAAVATCLLALVMLLAFPALRARHFTPRFRASQALSQIQRHIFVAQPEVGPVVLAPSYRALHALLANLDAAGQIKPMAGFRLAACVPLPRLLLRLRLSASRDSLSDPLL